MIVRELITRLGISVDERGADQAERRVNKLAGLMQGLAGIFAGAQVFGFFRTALQAASDVEQTTGALTRSFREGVPAIEEWAKTAAERVGATAQEMRAGAALMGSMLVPTLNFDREAAAKIAMDLTERARDIAAASQKMSPEEATDRLFKALSGSVEAVDQLGIGVRELQLKEFARQKGIKESVETMSVAKKTMLIYEKIMHDTSDMTGTAASETDTYQGQVFRLNSAWLEFNQLLGRFIMGPALRLVGWLREGARYLQGMTGDVGKMHAAFITLGVAMAVVLGPQLLLFGKLALLLGGIYLLVEDIYGLFTGKQSFIGFLLDEIGGLGTAQETVERFRRVWQDLSDIFTSNEFYNGLYRVFWVFSKIVKLQYQAAKLVMGTQFKVWGAAADFLGIPSLGAPRSRMQIGDVQMLNEPPSASVPYSPPMTPASGAGASGGQNVNINIYGEASKKQIDAGIGVFGKVRNTEWLGTYDTTTNITPAR